MHVCRRWRRLIFETSSFLGIYLVCNPRVPVAAMLAHFPSTLPLAIDYIRWDRRTAARQQEGMMLALRRPERVRRIRISVPDWVHPLRRQRLIMAIDDEFPKLEFFYIARSFDSSEEHSALVLPDKFRAPRLRNLILFSLSLSIQSPVITTALGLVTLSLLLSPPFNRFHPNDLLQLVSRTPQLETLDFRSDVSRSDLRRQLSRMPITVYAVLPKLRWFGFNGSSAYLNALLPQVSAPLLDKLQLGFADGFVLPLPDIFHFVNQAENLRCGSANLAFSRRAVVMKVRPCAGAKTYSVKTTVFCTHAWHQISFAAEICNELRIPLSEIQYLSLECSISPTPFDGTNRLRCRQILKSFGNLMTLRVPLGLVREVSNALQSQDGESPMEILPELRELACYWNAYAHSSFSPFIDARQSAGYPVTAVTLVH